MTYLAYLFGTPFFTQNFFANRSVALPLPFNLSLFRQLSLIKRSDFIQIHIHRRHLRIHIFQRLMHDAGNRCVAVPFVVRRDNKPRGVIGAAFCNRILVSGPIVAPFLPSGIVTDVELPVLSPDSPAVCQNVLIAPPG